MTRRSVTVTTLTPMWTGGANGTMDRIHETGLLGSLRWWYEAIVRGVGGSACDPSNATCRFQQDAYEAAAGLSERMRLRKAGLCDACQVFGATTWRRRFRLLVATDLSLEPVDDWPPKRGDTWPFSITREDGRPATWYLRPGHVGQLTLQLSGDPEAVGLILDLLRLIEHWGAIGARPQLGYGVIRCEETGDEPPGNPWDSLRDIARHPVPPSDPSLQRLPTLPSARRMFFARVPLRSDDLNGQDRITRLLEIKAGLRATFRTQTEDPKDTAVEREARYAIFGHVQGSHRRGSMVSVSRPYLVDDAWEIRVWGWSPATVKIFSAAQIIDRIHDKLTAHSQPQSGLVWEPLSLPEDAEGVLTLVDRLMR